ncbi:RNA recognition motif-containing protein [Coemansia sp. RSA 989]|nr:RNA recognition motif-containing protein [Coemansia sp. RSA 1086]KAJ1750590.1 RNA recognition motif-containing protein [Coemansia sp. RSA 1821]KAJ1865180.1 RNA recognition motif-containing protein [Coemansia sp. RSA 989]KAJ1872509.1 RNA recognition motif-containing protein [Coemansia sp. RSA 990]KAJ2677248.1 RNA recognition motif-containing protein [Coemansia sp. RSA 1085]
MSELDTLFDTFDQQDLLEQTSTATASAEAKKTSQPPEKYAKSMLFVRGIPKDATNEEFEEFFSNVGPVRSCFVVSDKNTEESEGMAEGDKDAKSTSKNRGFGFVQFVLAEDAARAIDELAEVKFRDKKRLLLDFAMRKGMQEPADKKPFKRPRLDTKQSNNSEQANKKQKTQSGVKVESRTITISNIAAGVTKKRLVKRLKKAGNAHSIVYPVPFKGATEEQLKDGAGGSAHVTFGDHKAARAAVKALDNHMFQGEKLSVKLKAEIINKGARLIIRNLPFKVRERDLENTLSDCGTVLEVDLPRKFTGGPLRGFAFVQMGDYASAQRAIEKWDQSLLHGRTISVAFAIAKDKFKDMEEKGEIEKPEFSDKDMADADESKSDSADDNNDMDVDKESDEEADDSDANADVVDESLQEGCTVFIRNLSFDSDEDGLFELFRKFGRLRYCRVVYDQETGRSRGTAFVCFWNPADATKCVEAAEKAKSLSEKLSTVPSDAKPDQRSKSVLLQEVPTSLDATSQFMLDGRMLSVVKAVNRDRAHDLAVEGTQKRKSKDKRSAYLLKEGVIFPDTPAAALMAPADLEHHIKEYSVRKNQILKNPNLYMSRTRLTVHNIPRSIDDAALRSAAISAVSKFKHEAKENIRKPLSKEEKEEGWDKMPRVLQAKIVRSSDRVDVNTGKPRSMGYGFIEFSTHAHALACLRYLNFSNTKKAFSKHMLEDEAPESTKKSAYKISRRSLRVMFAIENAQIVKKREMRFSLANKKASAKESDGKAAHADKRSAKGKPNNSSRNRPSQGKSKFKGKK